MHAHEPIGIVIRVLLKVAESRSQGCGAVLAKPAVLPLVVALRQMINFMSATRVLPPRGHTARGTYGGTGALCVGPLEHILNLVCIFDLV